MPRRQEAHATFIGLYRTYFPFVWRAVRQLGVPLDEMDDVVQEVFVVVHRRLSDFEGRSSMRTWLFGIARRVGAPDSPVRCPRLMRHEPSIRIHRYARMRSRQGG